MKCQICGEKRSFNDYDDEIICEHCGASYCLEYLGYYPEGTDERVDDGFEPKEWKDKYKPHDFASQPSTEGIIIADKQNPPEENRTRCLKCNKLIFTAFKSERCDCAD